MSNIIFFKDINDSSFSEVGGKAYNLGRLFGIVRIPNGFCVSSALFKKHINKKRISEEILSLNLDNIFEVESFVKVNNERIDKIRFDESDIKEILDACDNLESRDFAVRSSSVLEDLKGISFAGQYDSYLFVKKKDVLKKIVECYKSLYSVRAIYYRSMKGVSQEVSMPVIIQKLVDSDVSGVAYSKDPLGKEDKVIIESCHGMGEALVSGKVDPDKIDIFDDGRVNYRLGEKKVLMQNNVYCSNKLFFKKTLSEDDVLKIYDKVCYLESFFKCPQDVEFCIKDEVLYFLQSRPLGLSKS